MNHDGNPVLNTIKITLPNNATPNQTSNGAIPFIKITLPEQSGVNI
jgi:hypothetical protein